MGVTVDEAGRVTGLQLKGCGLKGSLPPVVAVLDCLETLDLRDNPDLIQPVGAQELGLLDMTGQMHFTDAPRIRAFLEHAALPEAEQRAVAERAALIRKHAPTPVNLHRPRRAT